jgi:hypothetical protein
MFSLAIFMFVLFRWFILHRLLGTKRMFLFDAVMWTVIAASNFAAVHFDSTFNGWSAANLAMTGLCIWWAHGAAKRFLMFDELQKVANGQGNSNGGTASPS